MSQKPHVYFGATDRQMEPFLDSTAFRQALVNGVLFHGDQVIPDIFLYISNLLADAVTADSMDGAFIKSCMRNGAIVPSFRTDTGGSFQGNLAVIRQQGIQGIHARADEVAVILQQAVRGKPLRYALWPSQPFSLGYRKTLERVMLANTLPSGSRNLEQFWENTENIRHAVFESIDEDELGGFRRGDIYNSLAGNLSCDTRVVHDIGTILAEIEDPQLAVTARRLLKWINYCYHYNQGRMFGLSPGLTSLDELDSEFATFLAEHKHGQSEAPTLIQAFQFPSPNALLTVNPEYILEIRDSDVGMDYFDALGAWQEHPGEDTSHILLDKLGYYISKLCALYLEKGQSILNWGWFIQANIPCGHSRWGNVVKDARQEIVGKILPGIGLVALAGKLAIAIYQSLPPSARDLLGPLLSVDRRVLVQYEQHVMRVSDKTYASLADVSFR